MRLSYQIPLITAITLIATLVVNIVTFEVALQTLFPKYTERVAQENPNTNVGQLDALVKIGQLNPKDQEEYSAVIAELSNLSTALKNISQNPELYISSGSSDSGNAYALSISSGDKGIIANNRNIINALLNPFSFSKSTAEGEFILGLIFWIIWVNLAWLFLVIGGYFFWTRQVFRPIDTIIKKVESFIDTREFSRIQYERNDEFFPLISTINNLYKTLSIQENIRSNFLSDLSHEIRTPITAVKLYLESIEDGVMKLDGKMISLLSTELARLIEITEKIMKYEHLSMNKFQDIRVERFDYKNVLEEMIQEYEVQFQVTGQKIVTNLPVNTMTRMDKNMCIQILHNIFSNFLKYAGDSSILTCFYEKESDGYVLIFADDGKGIAKNEIPYVKEKFYRSDKSRTRKDGSMGIGLSVIDQIAKLHKGTFHISPNTPKGVIFRIKIHK